MGGEALGRSLASPQCNLPRDVRRPIGTRRIKNQLGLRICTFVSRICTFALCILLIELPITDVSKFETKEVFLCHSPMVDYASANHALLSDPRLEHLLWRYPQNRGSGSLLHASAVAPRQNTPNIARTADFCFANGRLHLSESSPFVRSSIGAFVVEISTEPW